MEALRLPLIFLAEAVCFLLACINQRATSHYKLLPTLLTDAGIAALGFTLVKWVVEAESWMDQAVYVAGAVVGSWVGMILTKRWENG